MLTLIYFRHVLDTYVQTHIDTYIYKISLSRHSQTDVNIYTTEK